MEDSKGNTYGDDSWLDNINGGEYNVLHNNNNIIIQLYTYHTGFDILRDAYIHFAPNNCGKRLRG